MSNQPPGSSEGEFSWLSKLLRQPPHLITDIHFGEICDLINEVRRQSPLNKKDSAILRDRLEVTAAEYVAIHRHVESDATPTAKKKALERLEKNAARFMDAIDGIDASLWPSIYMRFDNPPKGFDEAVSTSAFAAADVSQIRRYFDIVSEVGIAAGKARAVIRKARSTPKKYAAVRWLVTGGSTSSEFGFANLYRKATGKRATANYSENYSGHPLGNHTTPFVRFVATLIKPFTPELCDKGFSKAVHDELKLISKK